MQAIVETLFDTVYLISVITIGILMIRGSKGNRQFRLFGWMAVVLGAGDSFHLVPRALALCTTGLENYTVPLGLGKWITSVTMTIFYAALLCLAAAVSNHWSEWPDICCIWLGRNENCSVHDASESMAQCRSAPFLGCLPQHPFRLAGTFDNYFVLS